MYSEMEYPAIYLVACLRSSLGKSNWRGQIPHSNQTTEAAEQITMNSDDLMR